MRNWLLSLLKLRSDTAVPPLLSVRLKRRATCDPSTASNPSTVGNLSNFSTVSNHSSGFTLIELLTVISIIGVLTAVVTVNLSSARKQARDVRRKTDISTIQTALELFANANGGRVPTSSGQALKSTAPSPWIPDSSGQLFSYVSNLPTDPTNDGTYFYTYQTNPLGCAALGSPAADTMYALDTPLEAENAANVNIKTITSVPADPCTTDFYKTGTYAVGTVVHYRVSSGGK